MTPQKINVLQDKFLDHNQSYQFSDMRNKCRRSLIIRQSTWIGDLGLIQRLIYLLQVITCGDSEYIVSGTCTVDCCELDAGQGESAPR